MSWQPPAGYEVVIGLEVHVQLRTASKLFSPVAVGFGSAPNHDVGPICLGLPGVLPVLNRRAVEYAVLAGLALNCRIEPVSVFARKNYFYPDLPKGYQISQYEQPIATGGWLEIRTEGDTGPRRIGLTRIHMEEDAGKLVHDEAITGPGVSHVDLNRAGVPLLEIVSQPDLRSPGEAGVYLRKLRQTLRYIGVSDADMEKGHFRCDANVSLRLRGARELGVRTELKNLNSFRFVEAALEVEIARQAKTLAAGGSVRQATLAYDPDAGRVRELRVKENADDYRYFPDPDLIPLVLDGAEVERLRALLPEMPESRQARYVDEHGCTDEEARQLSESRELADFFEAAARVCGSGRAAAHWILRDLARSLTDHGLELASSKLGPEEFGRLIALVEAGRITAKSGRELLAELVERGGDPERLVRERGLEAVSDSGLLDSLADAVLAEYPDNVERYRAGEEKVLHFLMGQVMKRSQGRADPGRVRAILLARLSG